MKKKSLTALRFSFCYFIVAILFNSCSKNELSNSRSNTSYNIAVANEALKFNYRNVFGIAFAKAVAKSPSLRTLIKNTANNKFDGISDILYWDLLNKSIEGINLNQYIKQFADDKILFQTAVDGSPLLTIYVPTLPSNWNATNWNEQNEIPNVAIEQNDLDNERTINFYSADGKMEKISDTLIPGSATLVIKENSRICSEDYANVILKIYSKGSDFPIFYEQINGQNLYYLSAQVKASANTNGYYNATTPSVSSSSSSKSEDFIYSSSTTTLNPDVIAAYSFFRTSWPRDYIYFGLTPTDTAGPLNNRNVERIKYFWFTSNGILPQISSETADPKIINSKKKLTDASWTSGSYHITFTILVNSKNGIGQTISKSIFLTPDQVWTVVYHQSGAKVGGIFIPLPLYSLYSVSPNNVPINLDILPFDISSYSVAWKISIEDTKPTQVITNTDSYSSQFAENFSFEPSIGLLKKVGLKFGASATQTSTQSHTVATTLGSIEFGDIVLNFSDPIITSEVGNINNPTSITTLDYSTGSVGLSIVPTRQW